MAPRMRSLTAAVFSTTFRSEGRMEGDDTSALTWSRQSWHSSIFSC